MKLALLILMVLSVRASMPPTLPHGHPAWHHEPLHINSVKEVIDTFDKMWHNYTMLHMRNVEAERHVALSEARVSSGIAVCDAEKRALLQICDLRISGLNKEACFKDLHSNLQNQTEESEERKLASCSCKLTACKHGSVSELTQQVLKRLDDIWHSKSMFLVSSDAKAELTLTAIQWAKDEFAHGENRDIDHQAKCNTNDGTVLQAAGEENNEAVPTSETTSSAEDVKGNNKK